MAIFQKKQTINVEQVITEAQERAVDVHKAAADAATANRALKKTLIKNGFTIKIYVAAGGNAGK